MTGVQIHSSSVVEKGAELGAGVIVGPFCHIGAKAKIGAKTKLHSHVVLMNDVTVGTECEIYPGATLGGAPQDVKYKDQPARLEIGDQNIIREHVTMHISSVGGHGITRVGSGGMFMAGSHIAHDCTVGDKVIMINHAVVGGHVQVGDGAMIGGNSAVHQFARIGMGAMVGGMTGVEGDVIPFGMVMGDRARLHGLNWIGLERRGFTVAQIKEMRRFYKELFEGTAPYAQRLAAARKKYADSELAKPILDFLELPSKRGICLPE